MRRHFFLGVLVALAGPSFAQNLVINGGFEAGSFAPPSNNTMTLLQGDTSITGWTVVTDRVAWIGASAPWGVTGSQGSSRFLDLTDYDVGAPFGGVQQVLSTVPGETYLLSFDIGTTTGGGSSVSIRASAGTFVQSFTSTAQGANQWTSVSMLFTASSPSTVLTLTGLTGSSYIGLDNVAVVSQVPEPSAYLMMVVGLAVTGLAVRRRQESANR